MQESYFVIVFNLDHRRYAIDQGRILTRYQTSLIVNINPLFLQSWQMQINFLHTLVVAMDD